MSTEYTIFVGQHEVETVTISTTRYAEDMADINQFRSGLTPEESRLFSFLSEYQLQADHEDEMEEFDDGVESERFDHDYDDYSFECCEPTKTPEEEALIKKVVDFLES